MAIPHWTRTPIWLLRRAGDGDMRFSIVWWTAPYPPGKRLIMGMEWKRAGIERRAVAIDVPSPLIYRSAL